MKGLLFPRAHVLPDGDQFLNRPGGGDAVDKLAAAIGTVIEALNGALAHGFELLLESGEFLAGHGDIEFWTACHIRLLFAIVARNGAKKKRFLRNEVGAIVVLRNEPNGKRRANAAAHNIRLEKN